MTERERYEDPELARRVRAWADETAPPAAPDRLVYGVMDAVERSPRRRGFFGQSRLRLIGTAAWYAALTIVITIGVAAGIVLSRVLPSVAQPGLTTAPPGSVTTSGAPSPAGSSTVILPGPSTSPLSPAARYDLAPVAIAAGDTSVWIATATARLVELDARTGARRGETALAESPTDIAVAFGDVWLVSSSGLTRLDPSTGATDRLRDAAGDRVTAGGGFIWVSAENVVIRVDPSAFGVAARIAVTGHPAASDVAVVGPEVWVGTNTRIQAFDIPTGHSTRAVSGDATDVVAGGGELWATRGTELVRIDPTSLATTFYEGMPGAAVLATDGELVWVSGPPGGNTAEVVAVSVADSRIVARATTAGSVNALAAIGRSAWVGTESSPAVVRFEVP